MTDVKFRWTDGCRTDNMTLHLEAIKGNQICDGLERSVVIILSIQNKGVKSCAKNSTLEKLATTAKNSLISGIQTLNGCLLSLKRARTLLTNLGLNHMVGRDSLRGHVQTPFISQNTYTP